MKEQPSAKDKALKYAKQFLSYDCRTNCEVIPKSVDIALKEQKRQHVQELKEQKQKIREWMIDTLAYPDIKEFDKRFGEQLKKAEKIE